MRAINRFAKYLVLFVGIFLAVQAAWATVPWMINYQGRLTDTGGKAINGSYTFKFRLYDAVTSGTKQWEESQTVTISESDNGVFSVVLGSSTALSSVDFNVPLWLSVQVDSDSEMTPRQRLTATGYAMNADQLDSLDSTKFVRTDIDSSSSGKLTITRAGTAIVITPSSAPDANTKLIDVQNTSGTTRFSVDYEGDVVVAGDLAVTGTMSGSSSVTGSTATTWTIDSDNTSGTEPASAAGLVVEGGSGDASLLWDATNDELDLNQSLNVTGNAILSAQGDLRLADADSSNYAAIQSPATISSNFTLTLPSDDGSANQVLLTDGSGGLSWSTVTDISGAGDVTAVGDITSGAAFTATSGADGTTLYFEGSSSDGNEIALTSANPGSDITVTIPATTGTLITTGDTGTVTGTMLLDDTVALATDTAGNYVATATGTSPINVSGSGSETAALTISCPTCLVSSGGSDLFTLAGTSGSSQTISSGNTVTIAAGTGITTTGEATDTVTVASTLGTSIAGSEVDANTLDFTDFEDTLDLDANLTLNQTTYTASQSYTGTTGTGLSYAATSLTTGTALDVDATNTAVADTAVQQVRLDLANAQATLANSDFVGLGVNFTNAPSVAGNTEVAMRIQHPVTANTTDNAVSALMLLENIDTSASGSTKVTDALRVQAATDTFIANAINVSDGEIDNAISIGANAIAGTNFSVTGAGAVTAVGLTSTGTADVTIGSGTFNNTSASGDAYVTGNLEVDGTIYGTIDSGATITHSLDAAYDDSGADPAVTVDTGSGAAGLEFQLTGKDFLIDGLDSSDVITFESETNNDTVSMYVNDTATANQAEFRISPSDGGVLIDTPGATELSSVTATDTREALAVTTDPSKVGGGAGADADGVIKLGVQEGSWEYIHYDASLASAGKFVFSAPLQIDGSSPASITFNDGSGTTRTLTYDSTATEPFTLNDELSVVDLTIAGSSPAGISFGSGANSQTFSFDPNAGGEFTFSGGTFAQQFRNFVRNGSFEAFSALETFNNVTDTAGSGTGSGGAGSNFWGGWSNFAPDEWVWKAGKIFQRSPFIFTPGGTVTATTLQRDYYHGKSAVTLEDTNLATTNTYNDTLTTFGTVDANIEQALKDLKPNTVYSVGVFMLVRKNDGTVAQASTEAMVDVVGEEIALNTTLRTALTSSATTVETANATDISSFPDSGVLLVDSERISYAGKDVTNKKFTLCIRAFEGTTAATHALNAAVTIAPFKHLTTFASATTGQFTLYKGQFATTNTASEVKINVICKSVTAGDECRFDAIQVVEGRSVPEFQPSAIVDTGDQTLYGSLRMGRTSDERGGILSVDKALRTRAIEFFEKDPGMSGTAGGMGSTGQPVRVSGSGSVTPTTSGTFYNMMPREFRITGTGSSTFQVESRDCFTMPCSAAFTVLDANETIVNNGAYHTTATVIPGSAGVELKFSASSGLATTDQWTFMAAGMNMAAQYNSYSGTATYQPGSTKIFKDPFTQKLTFQDGTITVTLDQIAQSGIGQPARVDYPQFFPGSSGSGTLGLNTTQAYTDNGLGSTTFDVEICSNGSGATRDGFQWRDNRLNGGQGSSFGWDSSCIEIPSSGGPYGPFAIPGAGGPTYGFTITFSSSGGTWQDGQTGDRWQFIAYPATSSTAIKTLTGNQGISVTGTGDSRTVTVKDCAANEVLKRNAGDTDWVCAADATTGGGGEAPTNATYIVQSGDATLTAEQVLTAGSGITLTLDTTPAPDTLTVAVDHGTSANKIVKLDANAKLPAVDGSLLTNITASSVPDGTDCSSGQYAKGIDGSGNAAGCTADDDTAETDTKVADDITVVSTKAGSFAGPAITSAAAEDILLSLTHTLNDTSAAAGTQLYQGLKLNLTETDKTGWDTVNLVDLQVGGTSKFTVNDLGSLSAGDVPWARVSGAPSFITNDTSVPKGDLASTGTLGFEWADGEVSNTLTASTLAADGANCNAGNYPLGVDAAGAAQSCTADDDTPDSDTEVPDDLTVTSTKAGSFAGPAITSATSEDILLNLTQTLNDTSAAAGTQLYQGLKLNLTQTDKTGWDTVNLLDLQVGGTSKWTVSDAGALSTGDVPWARVSGAPSFITDGNTGWDNSYGFITNDTSVPKGDLASSGVLGFEWADGEVSNTLTASDLVAGTSVVADAEVDNDLTLASTAAASVTKAGIGTTSTDALSLINTTAAAAGAQQISPRLRLTGQGWKTNATAASQTVDWLLQTVPVEGAAAPTSYLDLAAQVNAGGYASKMTLTSAGLLDVAGGAKFGSGDVALIDSTGKIAALTSTYLANLDGSALTNVTASGVPDGTDCSAGSYAKGIDGSGNAAGCAADDDTPDSDGEVPDNVTVASTTAGSITKANIGATPTDAWTLQNTTDAAAGAQQYSPALRLRGEGWKTDATAASMNVDWRAYIVPVEGAAAPTSQLLLDSSINDAAFATKLSLTSAGLLDVAGGIQAGSGNVGIVDSAGKIPAISSTYFADLSGANLTSVTASTIPDGTDCGVGSYARGIDGSGNAAGCTVASGSVNSFETFAVSGQSNVVADSSTDTLTLAAGTNITLTTNATNDTVTIAGVEGVASGTETGTTSTSFTLDTDSSGTVDVDAFLYFEDDANATAHSLAWDDGLDVFLFNDDVTSTGTIASTLTNAAGGSANPLDVTSALGIMDGSDTYEALDLNLTNANHTGSGNVVTGIDISGVTADAEATEYAMIIGSGWDRALSLGGNVAQALTMDRHTTADTAGNNLTITAGGATSGATDKAGGKLVLVSGTATGSGSSSMEFHTAAAGGAGTTDRAPTAKMTLDGAGKLDVAAGIQVGSGNVDLIDSTGKIAVLDSTTLANLSGAALTGVTASTATNLAADGANCNAGNYPLGVDTAGAVQSCTADDDTPDGDSEVPDNITLTTTANATIQKTDGALLLDASTASDTDFWVANNNDAGGDDDDLFQIGDGLTVGTNPFLTINTSGQVGIGTTSPDYTLHIVGDMKLDRASGDTGSYDIDFFKSRGTLASKTIVASGDVVGGVNFKGYDGSTHQHTALIRSAVDGTPGASDMPGNLQFLTTPDGSTTVTERMRISAAGLVGIGTTNPGALLDVDTANVTGGDGTEVIQLRSAAQTIALADGTTRANQRQNQFVAPTLDGVAAGGTETVTNAATVYIDAAPSGSNITISNPYSLWTDAGLVRMDRDGIGATATDGLSLMNTTDAAAGAQQYSPALRLHGEGWKTDATAASMNVDWRAYIVPVEGAAAPTSYLAFESSVNDAAFGNVLALTSGGSVGIGDTTPNHTLDVAGNIGMDAGAYLNFGDTTGTTGYGLRDNAGTIEIKNSGGAWAAPGGGSGDSILVDGGAALDPNFIDTAASGTVANVNFTLDAAATPDTIAATIGTASATEAGIVTTGTQTIAGAKTLTSNLTVQKTDGALLLDASTASDTDFWVANNNDAGGDDDDLFQIGDGLTVGTNPFLTINTSGQVGIGTTAPGYSLDVQGGAADFEGIQVYSNVASGAAKTSAGIVFKAQNSVGSTRSKIANIEDCGGNDCAENSLIFLTSATTGGAPTEKLRIRYDGNVGIGETSPGALLDLDRPNSSVNAELINFQSSPTTQTTTIDLANTRFNQFMVNTVSAPTAKTVTDAATVYIEGATTTAGSALITNSYALWTDAGLVRMDRDGIGATATDALSLMNTTDAAAGAQQVSPALRLHGEGWKTDATAASMNVDWRAYVVPVEGAATPTSQLKFDSSINDAAFANKLILTSAGELGLGAGTYLNFGSTLGTNGYGVRDNAGTIEIKNSGGAWAAPGGGSGDSLTVNTTAATDANLKDVAATGTVTGTTWTLDTGASPDDVTLAISNASATVAGAVTTGTQTIAGAKTFSGGVLTTLTNGAAASANPLDVTSALGIMDGTDTYEALDINLTNADHTGSGNVVTGIDLNTITGDAEATEYGIQIGTGWDRAISVGSPVVVGDGTNSTTISATGAVSYAGTAQPKRTIVLTASGAIIPAANAPQQLQTNGTNVSFYTLNYSGTAASAESAHWQFLVPDAYTGTTVNATLYWLTTSTTTTNAVKWFVDMNGYGDATTLDQALQTAGTVTDAPTGTANQVLVTTEIANVTTGWAVGEYAVVRVQRNAADAADTETALAKLLMIKLEWTASAESD